MLTRNIATGRKILWGYLTFLFSSSIIGFLLYKPLGPMILIGGFDFGLITGLILSCLLIVNTAMGIIMKYTRISVNFDLHIFIGSMVLSLGIIHALYNFSVLY